jgi:anti-anti-sigma regulatory factor
VQVVGPADRAVTIRISGWIRGLVAVGVRILVVDVTEATDCDARLLTVLARTRRELVCERGSLMVVGVQLPQFLAALRAASLDEIFIVYDVVRREAGAARNARNQEATRSTAPAR